MPRPFALSAAAAALLLRCSAAAEFNVMTYGAVGDGVADDTTAVRATLAAAAAVNGGTVLFPAGHTFSTGAFNLTSNIDLMVAGTIRASAGSSNGHYTLASQLAWFGVGPSWQAFIHSDGASNLTLRGGGTIDGNGAAWWACGCKSSSPDAEPCLGHERPRLLNLIDGVGLVIRDLHFTNSPMWNLRPSHFRGIYMTNLTITAPNGVACNSDGIDLVGVET